jgi:hypothetical protein
MKLTAKILTGLIALTMFSAGCANDRTPSAQPVLAVQPAPDRDPRTAPAEIEGRYRRETFDHARYPYLAAVGKISFLGGTWCSMTLVSERIAVTAGHCFKQTNVRLDLNKRLDQFKASVIFKPKGAAPVGGNYVQKVLKLSENPDYAIVELAKPVANSLIRPMRVAATDLTGIRSNEESLGCAGFNGDVSLGSEGWLMTVSRGIRIVDGQNTEGRLDTTCFATYGGSGGPLFRETGDGKGEFLGVVWGVTDEEYDQTGKLVKTEKIITSVTPAMAFAADLQRFGVLAEQ